MLEVPEDAEFKIKDKNGEREKRLIIEAIFIKNIVFTKDQEKDEEKKYEDLIENTR